MSTSFGAFIDIESAPAVIKDPPAPLHIKDNIPVPSSVELDELSWRSKYTDPQSPHVGGQTPNTPHNGSQTTRYPEEFFTSQPATPMRGGASDFVQTWKNPLMNRWRLLSICLTWLGNGMSDSGPGALLPYMEEGYHIGYAAVSLVFVAQAIGFLTAAFFTDFIRSRVGLAKTLMLSELLIAAGYIIIVCTPPFPATVVAFLVVGYGYSMNLALGNVFMSSLADATIVLGCGHGAYGIGGTIGPIIATAMASHGIIWSRYYLVTLTIRVICLGFVGWAFWNIEKEPPTQLLTTLQQTATQQQALETGEPTKRQLFALSVRNRITLIGALFTFAYQGAEVSISGWVISFLITYRSGDPSRVGYVSAGFWAGITVGRFTLGHLATRIGEKRFVYGLGLGAIIFQLLVWLIPNVIGEAVAVALLGVLLGPVAPCSMVVFLRLLPRRIQTTGISFVSSAGSSGGAVAPFLTGLLAQRFGTFVLHPICVGLFCVMVGCWCVLPGVEKREE
ncbi:MFS general substrate transporter [Tothia fuscella]|uniref:MFS general substrate transporter n=1 Tax=Tothia fuscella TaxID=1048955 RepID=A0A9P4TUM3_9PEZI|nr:MFS general substrate transporter [Tothia fuscella]